MKKSDKYNQLLSSIYESRGTSLIEVSARDLAIEAACSLSIEQHLNNDAYILSLETLTRRGELVLRKKCGEDPDGETEQHELFPQLQKRYPIPVKGDSQHTYKLLDHLSDEEIDFNINRMKAEVYAKQAHVDALIEFRQRRRSLLFTAA